MTAATGQEIRSLVDRLQSQAGAGFRVDDPDFVEQVLKLRAKRLAAVRTGPEDLRAPGQPVLCFSVAAETYGLALSELTEVMPLALWTPVPGQPQHLLGVTNVRGEIRPVLDLHAMLGLTVPQNVERHYVAYLRTGSREVGLRVDALDRIRFIDPGRLTLPHEAANGLPQRFVAGITPETLILLDVRQILALDVLQDRRSDYRRAI
ncbi:MAG: chemotaxis protein CheW [Solirubrobacterales bacterium]